jgi:hypothetical protein
MTKTIVIDKKNARIKVYSTGTPVQRVPAADIVITHASIHQIGHQYVIRGNKCSYEFYCFEDALTLKEYTASKINKDLFKKETLSKLVVSFRPPFVWRSKEEVYIRPIGWSACAGTDPVVIKIPAASMDLFDYSQNAT